MELGYLLYFLVVFVTGGAVSLALGSYLCWELLVHLKSAPWSGRTTISKGLTLLSLFLFVGLLFIPLRMLWVTRAAVIPGTYRSTGVWGDAALTMKDDGTFIETWKFTSEYDKSLSEGITKGTWKNAGRDWLTRDIQLSSFKGLAEYDREQAFGPRRATVIGYSGFTAIEVGTRSDIYFVSETR